MTMAGQNEQVSAVCPKCSANLVGGRDLPGCWRCGWEDYSAGYVDGNSKALFEVSTRTIDHSRGCGCDPCQSVAERLRRRGGAEAWLSTDEIVEPDRERRNGNGMPAGLEAGLGYLLGIELAEGDRSE